MRHSRFLAAAAATTALALMPLGPSAAHAAPRTNPACVTPAGINLNELLGIEERIIAPPTCLTALAGERWVRLAPTWVTAASAEGAQYPPGYVPQDPDPGDDFTAKFLGARYVQDEGTAREKSYFFGPQVIVTLDNLPVFLFVSPPLKPLSVGLHTSTVYLVMAAKHCDGLGDEPENCLPEGETRWADTSFQVVPRRPNS